LLWAGDLDPADPRGVGCSCDAEIVGLVVSIVTARAEVHRRRGRGEENAENVLHVVNEQVAVRFAAFADTIAARYATGGPRTGS